MFIGLKSRERGRERDWKTEDRETERDIEREVGVRPGFIEMRYRESLVFTEILL